MTTLSTKDWHGRAAALTYPTGHYIDGAHVPSTGKRFTVTNPATNQPLCEVAAGGAQEIDLAVASGKRAFRSGSWRRMAPRDRLAVLSRFAQLIEKNA